MAPSRHPSRYLMRLSTLLLAISALGLWPLAPSSAADQGAPAVEMQNGVVTSFAPVAKRVGPSVVTVFSSKTVKDEDRMQEIPPELRRFFGMPPGGMDEGGENPYKQQGL